MSARRMIHSFNTRRLLDMYPGADGAWSLRKVRTAYTGNCIRVRRSTDNVEQNIGFKNGMLDTGVLLAFIGSASGYITILYDQSGRDAGGTLYNLIQTTASRQPRIVNAGVLEVDDHGRAAIRFDGSDDYMYVPSSESYYKSLHSDKAFLSVVARVAYDVNPNIACGLVDTGGGLNTQIGYTLFYDDRAAFVRNNMVVNIATNGTSSPMSNSVDGQFPPNIHVLLTNKLDITNASGNARSSIKINTAAELTTSISTTTPSTANATRTLKIGTVHAASMQNYLNGTMQEVIIYQNDQSANADLIRNNVNGHYQIY